MKNVYWQDFERVDTVDMRAVSDLKDADLRELLVSLFDTGTNGRVFNGFSQGTHSGLHFKIAADLSAAVCPDGSYVSRAAGQETTLDLTASKVNQVYAYVVESEVDADDRRFVDPVTGAESTTTTNTRLEKTLAFRVTNTSNAWSESAPLADFATSFVSNGKTYSLVALYSVETDGSGITAVHDCRPLWTPYANSVIAESSLSGFTGLTLTNLRKVMQGVAYQISNINGTKEGTTGVKEYWWAAPRATLTDLYDLLGYAHTWTKKHTFTGAAGATGAGSDGVEALVATGGAGGPSTVVDGGDGAAALTATGGDGGDAQNNNGGDGAPAIVAVGGAGGDGAGIGGDDAPAIDATGGGAYGPGVLARCASNSRPAFKSAVGGVELASGATFGWDTDATGYLIVPAHEFVLTDAVTAYTPVTYQTASGGYITETAGTAAGVFLASLRVPKLSTITSVVFKIYNTGSTTRVPSFYVESVEQGGTRGLLATVRGSVTNQNCGAGLTSVTVSVNYAPTTEALLMQARVHFGNDELKLVGAVVTYSYGKLRAGVQ